MGYTHFKNRCLAVIIFLNVIVTRRAGKCFITVIIFYTISISP